MSWERARGHILAKVASLGIVAALCGDCAPASPSTPKRWCNENELAYFDIARETFYPELCAKIYPGAKLEGTPRDPGPQELRSRCFYEAAVASEKAEYCDRIPAIPWPKVEPITRSVCRDAVTHRDHSRIGTTGIGSSLSDYLARNLLKQMGYTIKDMPDEALRAGEDAVMWTALYKSIATSADFRRRLQELPDYSDDARTETTVVCDRPWIVGPGPVRSNLSRSYCLDFDHDGSCDFGQHDDDTRFCDGLELRFVDDRPAATLCGREPFDVELEISNRRAAPLHRGSAAVMLSGISPAGLGKSEADFVLPVPEIGPGGSARVRIPGLVFKPALDQERNYIEFGAVIARSLACPPAARTTAEVQRADGPECLATHRMRKEPPCAPPYSVDASEAAGAGCCFDLDKDRVCDEQRWATSGVGVRSVLASLHHEFPPVPVKLGVPFEVEVILENGSSEPVVAGSGLVQLIANPAIGITNPQVDLVRPLPAIAPGAKTTLTFSGLQLRSGPGSVLRRPSVPGRPQVSVIEFAGALCMRGGCRVDDTLQKEVAETRSK